MRLGIGREDEMVLTHSLVAGMLQDENEWERKKRMREENKL